MKRQLTFIIAALCASLAQAEIAVNTFGPGDAYNTTNTETISGPTSLVGTRISQGFKFTSQTSGQVTWVTVAGTNFAGTNAMTFSLYSDNAGVLGSVLSSDNLSGFSSNSSILSYTPGTAVNLTAGTSYWLIASANGDAFMGINRAPNGTFLPRYSDVGGTISYSSASSSSAFRVETVPEPATMVIAAGAALGLWRKRRQK